MVVLDREHYLEEMPESQLKPVTLLEFHVMNNLLRGGAEHLQKRRYNIGKDELGLEEENQVVKQIPTKNRYSQDVMSGASVRDSGQGVNRSRGFSVDV